MKISTKCISASIFLLGLAGPAQAQQIVEFSAGAVQYSAAAYPAQTDAMGVYLATDLNGDNHSDLIITGGTFPWNGHSASRGGQPGLILFNDGDNTFTAADGDVPMSEHGREIFAEDFNGDGILDIYIADHGYDAEPFPGFQNQLLLGTGTGFTDVTDTLPTLSDFTHGAGVGDIDGDGDLDIFASNCCVPRDDRSYFLINDGKAIFTIDYDRVPENTVADVPLESFNAELIDLDNDGFSDLIIGRVNGQVMGKNRAPTTVFWNDGAGGFSNSNVTALSDIDIFGGVENIQTIEIKGNDLDGNGYKDMLIHAYNANGFKGTSVQLLMNYGNRQFVDETAKRIGTGLINSSDDRTVPYWSLITDITNDGIDDIVWIDGDSTDDAVLFSIGRGDGCFAPVTVGEIAIADQGTKDFFRGSRPIIANGSLVISSVFAYKVDGNDTFTANNVPINFSVIRNEPNWFSNCSQKLSTKLNAGSSGQFELSFRVVQTEPAVVIEAMAAEAKPITELPQKPATFDGATGTLRIPELAIDGNVSFTNLEFNLIDAAKLQFQLKN